MHRRQSLYRVKLVKIDELNKTVITLSIICHESYDKRMIELKPLY